MNVFSAPKRHRPPQQVFTGNALGVSIAQTLAVIIKKQEPSPAIFPFIPSSLRILRLERSKKIFFRLPGGLSMVVASSTDTVAKASAGVQ